MRKVLSLLMVVALVMSTFTAMTVSAAAVAGADEKPTFSVEVVQVTASKAKLAINFAIAADDLKAYEEIENDDMEMVTYGKGINQCEVEFNLNADYFVAGSGSTVTGYSGTKCNKLSTGNFNYAHVATNDSQWITANEFTVASVTVDMNDTYKARYAELLAANNDDATATKAALVAELNKKTNLINYVKANVATQAYPAEGVIGSGEAFLEFYTKYRSDGNGNYGVTMKTGAELDETIEVGTKGDAAGNKVTWADCSVGADLLATGVKAVLENTAAAEGNQTQEVALSFDSEIISGGMACVFDVIVTFQDIANAATTSLDIVKAN